jgi:hypothetical protein
MEISCQGLHAGTELAPTLSGLQGKTVAGYRIPVTGKTKYRLQVAGKNSCRLPDTGCRENKYRVQVAGKNSCRLPDTGYRENKIHFTFAVSPFTIDHHSPFTIHHH